MCYYCRKDHCQSLFRKVKILSLTRQVLQKPACLKVRLICKIIQTYFSKVSWGMTQLARSGQQTVVLFVTLWYWYMYNGKKRFESNFPTHATQLFNIISFHISCFNHHFISLIFQLLNSLHIVAEYSLPSLLKTLFKWYEKQVRVRL